MMMVMMMISVMIVIMMGRIMMILFVVIITVIIVLRQTWWLQPCLHLLFLYFSNPLHHQHHHRIQCHLSTTALHWYSVFTVSQMTLTLFLLACYSTNSAIVGSVFKVSQMIFTLSLTIPLFQKSSSPSASSTSLVMHEVHVGALSIIQIHNLPTPHWPQDYKYSQKLQLIFL